MSVPLPGTGIFCNPKATRLAHGFPITKKTPFVSERSFCLKEGFFSVCMPAAAYNACAADDALFHRLARRYIRRKAS